MKLHQIYNPITATPFACSESYQEFVPCDALKPFIKCFWGSRMPYKQLKTGIPTRGIVTPDTCMDIIFSIDFTNNKIYGGFCGIDDRTFETYDSNDVERELSTFAIRFYAWSVILFSEESMYDVKNGFFDVGYHFSGLQKEIEPLLFEVVRMEDRIRLTEQYLLEHMHPEKRSCLMMDAVAQILQRKGNVEIGQLARDVHASNRQLERIFRENIGISPKQFSSLIRYQCLWNDVLFHPQFQVLDAVCKYGYADQSHLLHDFRRFHGMNPATARKYAAEHVVFLQDKM